MDGGRGEHLGDPWVGALGGAVEDEEGGNGGEDATGKDAGLGDGWGRRRGGVCVPAGDA